MTHRPTSLPALSGLIGLIVCVALGLVGCGLEQSVESAALVSLALSAPEGIEFGQPAPVLLEITNTSDRAVLITRVQPTTNPGGEAMSLFGSVYGQTEYDLVHDRYTHEQLAQQMTGAQFGSGLLLPGQSIVVRGDYRPVAQAELFDVWCYASANPYDQTAESLAPMSVYVLAGEQLGMEREYVPFSPARWAEISQTSSNAVAGVDEDNSRSVLVAPPAGRQIRLQSSHEVAFAIGDGVFTFDQAEAAMARLADPGAAPSILGYCRTLDGYVVVEDLDTWLLGSADQADRGPMLPLMPVVILNDVDGLGSGQAILVQVSAEQGDHLGPDVEPTGQVLWGSYPTETGDGMYTHGEFARVTADQFAEFLADVRENGKRLGVSYYFFGSRYFTLEDPIRNGDRE